MIDLNEPVEPLRNSLPLPAWVVAAKSPATILGTKSSYI